MEDFNLGCAAGDEFTQDENFAAADAREELAFLDGSGDVFDGEDESEFDADDYDDSMDGDHDSAMRDCGWGTDEDYGYYGGGDEGW